jgi:hypothetical protein
MSGGKDFRKYPFPQDELAGMPFIPYEPLSCSEAPRRFTIMLDSSKLARESYYFKA